MRVCAIDDGRITLGTIILFFLEQTGRYIGDGVIFIQVVSIELAQYLFLGDLLSLCPLYHRGALRSRGAELGGNCPPPHFL